MKITKNNLGTTAYMKSLRFENKWYAFTIVYENDYKGDLENNKINTDLMTVMCKSKHIDIKRSGTTLYMDFSFYHKKYLRLDDIDGFIESLNIGKATMLELQKVLDEYFPTPKFKEVANDDVDYSQEPSLNDIHSLLTSIETNND